MSEVSQRASERSAAERAGWSKQMSEQCERTRERKSEWPSTFFWISGYSGLEDVDIRDIQQMTTQTHQAFLVSLADTEK